MQNRKDTHARSTKRGAEPSSPSSPSSSSSFSPPSNTLLFSSSPPTRLGNISFSLKDSGGGSSSSSSSAIRKRGFIKTSTTKPELDSISKKRGKIRNLLPSSGKKEFTRCETDYRRLSSSTTTPSSVLLSPPKIPLSPPWIGYKRAPSDGIYFNPPDTSSEPTLFDLFQERIFQHAYRKICPRFTHDVEKFGVAFEHLSSNFNLEFQKKRKIFTTVTRYIRDITILLSERPCHSVPFEPDIEKNDFITCEWYDIACGVWSRPRWGEVLNKTGQSRRITLSFKEQKSLNQLFSRYGVIVQSKQFRGKNIIERVVFDLLEFLGSHQTDPCNLFVGAIPSENLLKHLIPLKSWESPETSLLHCSSSLSRDKDHDYKSFLKSRASRERENEKDDGFDDGVEGGGDNGSMRVASGENFPSYEVDDLLSSDSDLSLRRFILRWASLDGYPMRVMDEVKRVSEFVLSSRPVVEKDLVAVSADSFPSHQSWYSSPRTEGERYLVFCRVASTSPVKGIIEVFIDPLETVRVSVPIDAVFHFDKKPGQINILQEEVMVENANFFSNPLNLMLKTFHDHIDAQVRQFLSKQEIYIRPSEGEGEEEVKLPQLSSLIQQRTSFNKFLAEGQLLNNFTEEVAESVKGFEQEWVASIPPGLFLPPRFSFALRQLASFMRNIRLHTRKEILKHSNHLNSLLSRISSRIQSIVNGERKTNLCDWWLSHIESKVDGYLVDRGYSLEALPEDYTSKPPPNLDAVIKNRDLIAEIFEGEDSLGDFVEQTTKEVYDLLDPLVDEILFVKKREWVDTWLQDDIKWTEENITSLSEDLDYLLKVKDMDERIAKERQENKGAVLKKVEMTNVVPVAGLIMARFHIHECELSTAIDLWKDKEAKTISPTLKENTSATMKEKEQQQHLESSTVSEKEGKEKKPAKFRMSIYQYLSLSERDVFFRRSSGESGEGLEEGESGENEPPEDEGGHGEQQSEYSQEFERCELSSSSIGIGMNENKEKNPSRRRSMSANNILKRGEFSIPPPLPFLPSPGPEWQPLTSRDGITRRMMDNPAFSKIPNPIPDSSKSFSENQQPPKPPRPARPGGTRSKGGRFVQLKEKQDLSKSLTEEESKDLRRRSQTYHVSET